MSDDEISLGINGDHTLADEEEEKPKELKFVQLFALGLALLSSATSITVLFPFLKFMIQDMGIPEKDAGPYVGLVASMFMAGRASTSVLWGMFADRYGRKPPVLISLASLAILAPLFGVSNTVAMAAVLRFISGSLNSIIGIGKVVANEIASNCPVQQARAMSMVSFAWSAGNILGPGLGGALTGVYDAHPYLPPMAMVAFMCAVSCVLVSIFLPETLQKVENRKKGSVREFVKSWKQMHPVIVYCVWSLQSLGATELFNLWGGTDRALGGLGLSPSKLGLVQSVTGVIVLISASMLQTPLIVYWGIKKLSILCLVLVVPVIAGMPLLRFVGDERATIVAACVLFPWFQLLTSITFCTQFMFINNSNPPETRALAQGVGMSMASIFKCIGPIVTGSLFAWSISSAHAYPFNFCFTWYVQAFFGFITLCLTLILPPTIDTPQNA
eukprot:TRINITY_DN4370_c0_g1_i1.p2 TRINITY_DN4370_c0_g1~~TRINITY_DN4370_c0_g1_i1.p2  ORF type:complete len:443 (+),score=139.21 TRINITY_DN4370_c0_g1_i1:1625-2953(+)